VTELDDLRVTMDTATSDLQLPPSVIARSLAAGRRRRRQQRVAAIVAGCAALAAIGVLARAVPSWLSGSDGVSVASPGEGVVATGQAGMVSYSVTARKGSHCLTVRTSAHTYPDATCWPEGVPHNSLQAVKLSNGYQLVIVGVTGSARTVVFSDGKGLNVSVPAVSPPRLASGETALAGWKFATWPVQPNASLPDFSVLSTAPAPSATDCPSVPSHPGTAASIDYVDFLRVNNHDYYSGLVTVPPLTEAELGEQVSTVRCSFAQLNDATGADPGRARNGDAAFILPGTPVYAVRGWPSTCRLAARHNGQLYVYLAYRDGTKVATPEACALRRP
jgi:hypothetical protein